MIIKIIIKKFMKTFDEIKELTDEINHDDLMYYFKDNAATKDLMISIMV